MRVLVVEDQPKTSMLLLRELRDDGIAADAIKLPPRTAGCLFRP
jgi:DNA-binding response OmpR family regulator